MYKIEEYIMRLKSLDKKQIPWRHLNGFDLLVKLGEVPSDHNEFCIVSASIKVNIERNRGI
jgi:hypothetical protein